MAAVGSLLMACQPAGQEEPDASSGSGQNSTAAAAAHLNGIRVTDHRDGDDLVTAGLGLDGLTSGAPTPVDPEGPTAAELRMLAIHTSWTSLAALNPAGGLGGLFDSLPAVPGREFAAFRHLPDAAQPARLLVQLPDAFDLDQPCLVVAAASGSRGVYGAIPLAAPWALPAGCATAYTDKGAGTDFFDFNDATGVALSGLRVARGETTLGFEPAPGGADGSAAVGMSHAHSGDHAEADWGLHVLDAARFGLEVLNEVLEGEFTPANTRIIATGLSNGGGAVLRAAEQDEDGLLDAVVALMPNISPAGVRHAYDYATVAALYQPCMLADLETTMALPLGNPMLAAAGAQRCAALTAAGLLEAPDPALARQHLVEIGFDDFALDLAPVNVALDLWRAVTVTYASAYLRRGPFDMPCDFAIAAPDATRAQRQAWWATHSGIAPGGGIEIIDNLATGRDRTLPGLLCLRELFDADNETAQALRQSVEATRASAQLSPIPVLVV
ncbi:MAG: 3-hydroxybutyrate oligomer hydrolase family protein, partial [Wenzhouxiangella sp.]